jgi:DNA-binding NtrC family response regulator
METQPGIKTLIVEDSMPTRRMLRARLESVGCTIVGEADNPNQGLKLFRDLDPQIVTLDLIMPHDDLNTEGLSKIIREEKPGTSVIVISSIPRSPLGASSEVMTAMSYLSQGAIAYLEKPFVNFDQLRDRLHFLYPQMTSRMDRQSV